MATTGLRFSSYAAALFLEEEEEGAGGLSEALRLRLASEGLAPSPGKLMREKTLALDFDDAAGASAGSASCRDAGGGGGGSWMSS